MKKNFILNADDFGLSLYHNQAVLDGYKTGILTGASLCTNTEAFYDAVENILPQCHDLGLGIHLNLIEDRALTDCFLLTDKNRFFNKSYLYLILNQYKKEVLEQIETEFRAQIEKALKYNLKIDHLDSHVHTHAIPEIFKITCKLAKEYNIEYIRTQKEKPYLIKQTNIKTYAINFLKILLLDYYTEKNKKIINKFQLKTNDNIIGVGYTGMMDSEAIFYGISSMKNAGTIEALIHPCKYDIEDSHLKEFIITQDKNLKQNIENLGFTFTNYKFLIH